MKKNYATLKKIHDQIDKINPSDSDVVEWILMWLVDSNHKALIATLDWLEHDKKRLISSLSKGEIK